MLLLRSGCALFAGGTGSGAAPDGACPADDMECLGNVHDRLGMEAIRSLHQQLDDDDNGNIDLTESDDVSTTIAYSNATALSFPANESLS